MRHAEYLIHIEGRDGVQILAQCEHNFINHFGWNSRLRILTSKTVTKDNCYVYSQKLGNDLFATLLFTLDDGDHKREEDAREKLLLHEETRHVKCRSHSNENSSKTPSQRA